MKYEVRNNPTSKWETCIKAVVTAGGWLHYELSDGTNGILRPAKYGVEWRQKPSQKGGTK